MCADWELKLKPLGVWDDQVSHLGPGLPSLLFIWGGVGRGSSKVEEGEVEENKVLK